VVSFFFFNVNYYPLPPTKTRHCLQCPKVERYSIEKITWSSEHWQSWNTLKQKYYAINKTKRHKFLRSKTPIIVVLWFTSSLGFTSKNDLNALYGSRIGFPSSFLKSWQTWSFLVRFPRLCRACSLWKWGYKSWIARCISPLGCVSSVNGRLSKDSLLRPSLMNCILSSQFIDTIRKERHCALQVHLAHRWQTFSHFARRFFAKVLLPVPGMYEIKELEDSPDNQTFASISQRISSGIPWFINNLNLAHLAR